MSTIALPARISVTSKHIAEGKPRRCALCPIALAVSDAIGAGPEMLVTVLPALISIGPDECEAWEAVPPPAVPAFIAAFDNGRPVQPFEFDVEWEPVP